MPSAGASAKKVQFKVGTELKSWYEARAEEIGISMAAYMAMALHEYKRQAEAIQSVNQITQLPEFQNELKMLGRPVKRTK
jgi:predicted phage-related endonuclease